MNHFNFRLQKYLDLKQQQEEFQRLILANAQAFYDEEQSKLALIDGKIDSLLDYSTTLRQIHLNIELLLLAESYHRVLLEQKKIQILAVEEALGKLVAERERFLSLQKERKLLERLRTRQYQQFYQDWLRDEQKALDEVGSSKYEARAGAMASPPFGRATDRMDTRQERLETP
jgi:flagellar FliJ protein